MKADEKKYFPMFVDLTQKKVTVIGAGNIAKRRIETLLSFAGTIEVIAPDACERIKELAKEAARLICELVNGKTYKNEKVTLGVSVRKGRTTME